MSTDDDRPELLMAVGGADLGTPPPDGWGIAVLVHVVCGHAMALAQLPVVEAAAATLAERAAAAGRTGTARWHSRRVDNFDGRGYTADPVVADFFNRVDCPTCRRDFHPANTALRHAIRTGGAR